MAEPLMLALEKVNCGSSNAKLSMWRSTSPLLLILKYRSVYWPRRTLPNERDAGSTSISGSSAASTVTVAVPVLLPGTGSSSVALTEAVLTISPGVTGAVNVMDGVVESPDHNSAKYHVTVRVFAS